MTDCHGRFDCDRLSQWARRWQGGALIIICFSGGINRAGD